VTLTGHLLLVPWPRKGRAIPLFPYGPYSLYRASVPVQGWPLPFFFTFTSNQQTEINLIFFKKYIWREEGWFINPWTRNKTGNMALVCGIHCQWHIWRHASRRFNMSVVGVILLLVHLLLVSRWQRNYDACCQSCTRLTMLVPSENSKKKCDHKYSFCFVLFLPFSLDIYHLCICNSHNVGRVWTFGPTVCLYFINQCLH